MIYFFPFAMDIVVSLLLFVGRHSMAAMGVSEAMVGSIPLLYGIGYVLSGIVMRAIISRRYAKVQMVAGMALLAGLSVALANLKTVLPVQILFCFVPFGTSLFFNAFQTYMLGISNDSAKPLGATISIYTFAWSLGFGLGPFVCGFLRGSFSWSQTYYIAAFVSVIMAVIVLAYKPRPANQPAEAAIRIPESRPILHVPGWMGVLIGLLAWLIIATYWPVIAVSKNITPEVKGLVEFFYAIAQAIGALLLITIKKWQHRPWFIPLFGILPIGGLLVFGMADTTVFFIAGASLLGLYTATTFIFSAYHCMLDSGKASKRIAVNEMVVGAGYVIAPLVARFIHHEGKPFYPSFIMAAIFVAFLIVIQTGIAFRLNGHCTVPGGSGPTTPPI